MKSLSQLGTLVLLCYFSAPAEGSISILSLTAQDSAFVSTQLQIFTSKSAGRSMKNRRPIQYGSVNLISALSRGRGESFARFLSSCCICTCRCRQHSVRADPGGVYPYFYGGNQGLSPNQSKGNDKSESEPEIADLVENQGEPVKTDMVSSAMIAALKGYKKFISPILPPSCRFLPTCSAYSIQAIQELGPAKGVALTAWRLIRCNPFHFGSGGRGYDPPRWPPVPYDYHYP